MFQCSFKVREETKKIMTSQASKGVDSTSGHSNDHKSGVSTLKESRHARAHFS